MSTGLLLRGGVHIIHVLHVNPFAGCAMAAESTCLVKPKATAAQAQILVDIHNAYRQGEPAQNMAKIVRSFSYSAL